MKSKRYLFFFLFGLLTIILNFMGCTTFPWGKTSHSAPLNEPLSLEEKWGINILGIKLSATGYMLDFRYRVLDPEKALFFTNRRIKPYLIDQSTGAKLFVPNPPKVGRLRQAPTKLIGDRTYFTFFANPGRFIKSGDMVTVVIGDLKAENLVVE